MLVSCILMSHETFNMLRYLFLWSHTLKIQLHTCMLLETGDVSALLIHTLLDILGGHCTRIQCKVKKAYCFKKSKLFNNSFQLSINLEHDFAEPIRSRHGTLGFRGTNIGKHCPREKRPLCRGLSGHCHKPKLYKWATTTFI
jgi:hypothetical protein